MGDKVLRSIEDFIVEQTHAAKHTVQTAGTDNCDSGRGTPLSPNAASPEPSVEPSTSSSPEHSIDQSQQAKSSPASNVFLIRSVVRTLVGGLFLVIVVAVAWQTYQDDQTRTLIKALAHSSVSWLSSSLKATQRGSASSAQSVAKTSDQVVQMPTTTSMQANEVAEVRQQLLAVVNDLAVMRRDVEQLSSKHEQLSRDVETVQAIVQGVTEKISSFSQRVPAPTQAQSRRSVPRLVRAEITRRPPDSAPVSPKTSQQSAAAPIPPTTSPTGTATLSEQPPRPPLPVPTAEAPSPLH
ncbi:MAG: hypothetical protein C5B58_07870 [Acidobacteria bacterium]|nr:MAG: hypothetical protein C5B58_07870 [Acidobacteriota bacterium]